MRLQAFKKIKRARQIAQAGRLNADFILLAEFNNFPAGMIL